MKKVLAVAVDSRMGISFNGRACSKDSAVLWRLIELAPDNQVHSQRIPNGSSWQQEWGKCIDKGGVFYADLESPKFMEHKFDRLHVICWNREYPSDKKFHLDDGVWKKVGEKKYPGSSHKEITETIYRRRKNKNGKV